VELMLVVGLPASGKTHLIHQLQIEAESAGMKVCLLDDPRRPEQLEAFIRDVEQAGADLVLIADPALCDPVARQAAEGLLRERWKPVSVSWKFFENDPQQCVSNAVRRRDGRNVLPDIRQLAHRYVIPKGVDTIPVWTEIG
jgi:hypothetical protein